MRTTWAARWRPPAAARRTHTSYRGVRRANRQQRRRLPTDHLFTGQKQDDTGLLYYRARYYDKLLGAFISPDPVIPDAENVFAYNRYMYTLGNPLKYNDPSGFCSVTESGERDASDAACWALADQVRTAWDADYATVHDRRLIHFGACANNSRASASLSQVRIISRPRGSKPSISFSTSYGSQKRTNDLPCACILRNSGNQ